jgi:hypothetical protein
MVSVAGEVWWMREEKVRPMSGTNTRPSQAPDLLRR